MTSRPVSVDFWGEDDLGIDYTAAALLSDDDDLVVTITDWIKPAWHAEAACRGVGAGAFFVEQGGDVAPAKAMCAECPVIEACAQDSLGEMYGIWAGTNPIQRRDARRTARNAATGA